MRCSIVGIHACLLCTDWCNKKFLFNKIFDAIIIIFLVFVNAIVKCSETESAFFLRPFSNSYFQEFPFSIFDELAIVGKSKWTGKTNIILTKENPK